MSMKLIATSLTVAVHLAACAAISSGNRVADVAATLAAPQALIAHDFVNALRQLESLPPERTTVGLLGAHRGDAFTLAMQDALADAGYATRWVQQEGPSSLFKYHKTVENAAASASREIYELSIGSVALRRGYATDGEHRVQPVTALFLRGADADQIVVNDDIFKDGLIRDNPISRVDKPFVDDQLAQKSNSSISREPAFATTHSPDVRALQNASIRTIPDSSSPLDPLIAAASSAHKLSLPLIDSWRARNVFELGESNFENVLVSHTKVAEQVLTFGNDSMRLGRLNKQLVTQMVSRFNPQTDVFVVIGCSMGPTRVGGGNAALALGRAGRVAEALRFAGVDDRHILDEGCWASDKAVENLPGRGVVLSLNRRSNVIAQ